MIADLALLSVLAFLISIGAAFQILAASVLKLLLDSFSLAVSLNIFDCFGLKL